MKLLHAAAFLFAAALGSLVSGAAHAATLYISEFANGVSTIASQEAQIFPQPAITDQTVAITGSSAQSAAFNSKTKAIMVECDTDCSVVLGSNPTATTTNFLMGDGVPYFFAVQPGQKIAVISNTSGGSGSDVNIVAVGGNAVTTNIPVGIDQTTPGTTNAVQVIANTSVSTLTTAITRPTDTNAYAANDAFANSTTVPTTGGFTFTSACRASGGNGTIQSAAVSASAGTAYIGEIWVFDQAVTATNDNSALSVSDSDILNLVGVVPFNTSDVNAANSISYITGLNLGYTCVGTANLRYLVKILQAVTPGNAEVLNVRLQVAN